MEGIQSPFFATAIKGASPLQNLLANSHTTPTNPIYASMLPKTRYYGSKLRLIEWLSGCAEDLNFHTALDAFGGTGTVSLMLKHLGKHVTYNDVLASNQYVAKAILHKERNYAPAEIIKFFNNVEPTDGFISNTFSNQYYYDQENQWLDGATQAIHRLRNRQKKADSFYCLYQACLQKRPFNLFHRKNLYIRKNCQRNTKFGNWKTWETSFQQHINTATTELTKAKNIECGKATILLPTDASDIKPTYDLIYIDPPYLKQSGSGNSLTYLDRYHFLEGMADYENWATRINRNKKNLPLEAIQPISEWNSKATFKDRLFGLVDNHRKSTVLLSYSSNGFPTIDEITTHFKQIFPTVVVLNQHLSHALKKGSNEEVIILGIGN